MGHLRHKRILIISPEPWDHHFISKHHYAISLAARENTVYFLNPPTTREEFEPLGYERLFLINYKERFRGANRLPGFLRRLLTRRTVSHIRALAGTKFDVVWSFDVYRLQDLDLFDAETCIYFAADSHAARELELVVARHAQLVLSPSSMLLASLNTSTPKHFINHAVADHFLGSNEQSKLPGGSDRKIGYVGNLHSRYLDFRLLKRVVEANAHCDFVFAGNDSGTAMEELMKFDNVYFVGALHTSEVPGFLRACDGLLLCYDTDRFGREASNSHKILEYLASGRVVMSTRMSQYHEHRDIVLMPQANTALPDLVRDVMDKLPQFNDAASQARRMAFASEHTYGKQLNRVERLIGDVKQRSLV